MSLFIALFSLSFFAYCLLTAFTVIMLLAFLLRIRNETEIAAHEKL